MTWPLRVLDAFVEDLNLVSRVQFAQLTNAYSSLCSRSHSPYLPPLTHRNTHTHKHTCKHTLINTHIHKYIHTHAHIYKYTHIHTYAQYAHK